MEKRVLVLILLLSAVSADLWSDRWHSPDEHAYRRSLLVHHPLPTDATGPAEVNLTFSGVHPYCDDANGDYDLDDVGDMLSLSVTRAWPNNSLGGVDFQLLNMTSFACVSNRLMNATLRFRANFTSSAEDYGYGPGNSLYFVSYHPSPYASASSLLASPSETAVLSLGPEERLWQDAWSDWNGNTFDYRARLHVASDGTWRQNVSVSLPVFFHGNMYCYDVNGNGEVDYGDLLSMRVVREYDDGFAETVSSFSGECFEDSDMGNVSFVADLPPTITCSDSFFVYYKAVGLVAPEYPDVSANSTGSARRDREVRRGASNYCGNFVCEESEDVCDCPNDCCPTVRNGVCDTLCADPDPDCCEDCWSSRYLCDGGQGDDCYPGRCENGACFYNCTSPNDCSSGFCYNKTATLECHEAPAQNFTFLAVSEGYACEEDYDVSSFKCQDICLSVSSRGYYEYDGGALVMDFSVDNDCAAQKTVELRSDGPLASYSTMSSVHESWDGSSLVVAPGASASVLVTLENIPADLSGVREFKLSAVSGEDVAGDSPRVVVLPNTAFTLGRGIPPLVNIGRTTYVSSIEGVPVRVVVSTW